MFQSISAFKCNFNVHWCVIFIQLSDEEAEGDNKLMKPVLQLYFSTSLHSHFKLIKSFKSSAEAFHPVEKHPE